VGIRRSLFGVVELQPLSQASGIDPDDRIDAGIVGFRSENVAGHLHFLNRFVGVLSQVFQ
jgi:hypothetical protein